MEQRKSGVFKFRINKLEGYLLFLPAIVLISIFKIYPLLKGIYLSFMYQSGAYDYVFAGLMNYKRILSDSAMHSSLINVGKCIVFLPIVILIPLIIAYLLYQQVPGWRFFRSTYFFSYLLAPVMVGFIFKFIFGSEGPLNTFLKIIGLERFAISWLNNSYTAMWAVLIVFLWCCFGFGVLVYLAGMSTLNKELIESATLDGANSYHILVHVIIPHLSPTMGYWSILSTLGLLLGLFPFIYSLTQGGPGYATMMPEYYIYLIATKFSSSGYASTLGIVLFLFVFILSLIQIRIMYERE